MGSNSRAIVLKSRTNLTLTPQTWTHPQTQTCVFSISQDVAQLISVTHANLQPCLTMAYLSTAAIHSFIHSFIAAHAILYYISFISIFVFVSVSKKLKTTVPYIYSTVYSLDSFLLLN